MKRGQFDFEKRKAIPKGSAEGVLPIGTQLEQYQLPRIDRNDCETPGTNDYSNYNGLAQAPREGLFCRSKKIQGSYNPDGRHTGWALLLLQQFSRGGGLETSGAQ
jgi:hypothetical protein